VCQEYGLVYERLLEMKQLRQQLGDEMASIGFSFERHEEEDLTTTTRGYRRLVRAAVCLGLYPNLIKVRRRRGRWIKAALEKRKRKGGE